MIYTLIKRVGGLSHLLINDSGFPYMIKDQEEAHLEKIEQQMKHDEPILVHASTLGENNE